jgi:hypothetical protein
VGRDSSYVGTHPTVFTSLHLFRDISTHCTHATILTQHHHVEELVRVALLRQGRQTIQINSHVVPAARPTDRPVNAPLSRPDRQDGRTQHLPFKKEQPSQPFAPTFHKSDNTHRTPRMKMSKMRRF